MSITNASLGSMSPLLDARLWGVGPFVCPVGESVHYITIPFDCKFSGLDLASTTQSYGDKISLQTDYYVPPLDVWKRFKKFGKNWNVIPNERDRVILFPTEPREGVRIAITYFNASEVEQKVYVNLFTFVDQQKVEPSLLQEGEDW